MSERFYNATRSQMDKGGEPDDHLEAKEKIAKLYESLNSEDKPVFVYRETYFAKNLFNDPDSTKKKVDDLLKDVEQAYGITHRNNTSNKDKQYLDRPFVLIDPKTNENIIDKHKALSNKYYEFYRHSYDLLIILYGDKEGKTAQEIFIEIDSRKHNTNHQQYNDRVAQIQVRRLMYDAYFVRIHKDMILEKDDSTLLAEIKFRMRNNQVILEF